jgi:hypothetical protein
MRGQSDDIGAGRRPGPSWGSAGSAAYSSMRSTPTIRTSVCTQSNIIPLRLITMLFV